MKILFIHQNLPAQFAHLLRYFGSNPAHTVAGICQGAPPAASEGQRAVAMRSYAPHRQPTAGIHNYLYSTEAGVLNGQAVVREIQRLREQGFTPDLTLAHPSWGESLYVKDVLPDRPLVNYCEFFYRAHGLDCDFDPAFPLDPDDALRIRTRNAVHLLSLDACDAGVSPTHWQRSVHPACYQDRIDVIHEGVDTRRVAPNPAVSLRLPDGAELSRQTEVITFTARGLEPYRGFHTFMRALPEILRRRPACHVVVTGGDDVVYGARLPAGETWRQKLLAETDIDTSRVHFVGRVPWPVHLQLMQVSTVHVYLTLPFVLSWSLLEAMSAGAAVVASDTAPVREVIEHEANGLLVDFLSPAELADAVVEACGQPTLRARLGQAARATAIERYDVRESLKQYDAFFGRLVQAG